MTYSTASRWLDQQHPPVAPHVMQAWFEDRGRKAAPRYGENGQYTLVPPTLAASLHRACRRYEPVVVDVNLAAGQIDEETAGWQSYLARVRLNPGGIGAEDDDPLGKGYAFETLDEALDAFVAHILTYCAGRGPWNAVDPRFPYVPAGNIGTRQTVGSFARAWATNPSYGEYIAARANTLLAFAAAYKEDPPMTAQIPGFTWVPADSEHFRVGRAQKIIGGAQHYSGGTNSLGWLTTDSGRNPYNPPAMVSAHLLIKTNPTMEDRGWQMVRFEDTAYTTGGIVNPKTVAIEKEHLAGGTLDDMDYAVMAQTWVDVAAYVAEHKLGEIPLTRQAIKGHNEWVGDNRVCPDGISVNRIVAEAAARAAMAVNEMRVFEVPGIGTFTVGGGFLRYWDAYGGLAVFGYPLTNEIVEDGVTVQYFERAVFEHHPGQWPERWDVLLRRLGAEALKLRAA